MSLEDGPEQVDEWVTRELCLLDCQRYEDHVFVEWVNPGHFVTSECQGCGEVREIQDNGR